jgi:hypothetical protein
VSDGITVDFSEIDQLSASLGQVRANAGKYIRSAVTVTAKNIDKDWERESKGMAHAPAFPYSITYDISTFTGFGVSVIQADIGPDKDRRQGGLGNLIEFGSVNNPPQGLGHGALQRNEADFERGLSLALEDAEHDAGVDGSVSASAGAVIRGSYR